MKMFYFARFLLFQNDSAFRKTNQHYSDTGSSYTSVNRAVAMDTTCQTASSSVTSCALRLHPEPRTNTRLETRKTETESIQSKRDETEMIATVTEATMQLTQNIKAELQQTKTESAPPVAVVTNVAVATTTPVTEENQTVKDTNIASVIKARKNDA